MASGSVPDQPTESDGLFAGFLTVAPWRVPILFLRSLHPGYIPPGTQPSAQPDEGPAFTFGSPDGQDSSFFQGVELAARLVSPYTVLPAEIRTMLEGIVTFSAATRFRDLLGAFGATEGSPPTEGRADISEDRSPTNDKDRKNKKPQQTRQRTSPPATTSIGTGQLPKTAMALGALSSLTAAAAASPSGSKEVWKPVPDAKTLDKFGRDPDYLLSGNYFQTANIDGGELLQPIGSDGQAFTGKYNGQGYTIENLRDCFVKNLKGEVDGLRFTDASIGSSSGPTAVVACKVSRGGTVSNIRVENAHVDNRWDNAAIVGGEIDGKVANITAVDCSVSAGKHAGIGGGAVLSKGALANITAINCTVENPGYYLNFYDVGIGAGQVFGSIANIIAINCNVKTLRDGNGDAGIGAGAVYSRYSDSGGGVSNTVANTIAINCTVGTSGRGDAGIGVGKVIGRQAYTVANTMAINCTVETSGDGADAGIGAGSIDYGTIANIANTMAFNCKVKTSGKTANAGIGTARRGTVLNTKAVNTTVESRYADASIRGGFNPTICNVRINGTLQPDTAGDCLYLLDHFCEDTDPRLLKPNCQPGDCYSWALTNDTFTGFASCPVALETISTTPRQITTPEAIATSAHSPTSPTVTNQLIEVANAETLVKIGTDHNYPLNGTYIQTTDIDASSLSQPIRHFTGQYNGQHHAITNLDCCLVDNLEGDIGNLHFTGASISASKPTGVVACGLGGNGKIHDILVDNSQVITSGNDADAGIGAGVLSGGTVVNTTVVNSTVTTAGEGADAGIGAGSIGNGAAISQITALNSRVETSGNNANAAIGVGAMGSDTRIADTLARGSSVTTSGYDANAAIGTGAMDSRARMAGTRSDNSQVVTSGVGADSAIGAGEIRGNGTVTDTRAVNSTVTASGNETLVGIAAGRFRRGAVIANTTQVNSFARSTGYSSGVAGGPLPATPAPPVANTTMNFSGLPGATMMLPTTAAPLAATLSTGAVAGIALGAAAAFVVAGVVAGRYIYRHYCRGSSPAAADDSQELVAINTVGQAEEAGAQSMIEAVSKEARGTCQ
ncbi:hypothetical protein [Endozoicomonas sp. ALB115]|uniref:hypothetical protein n=1 Tax=Endozoicomonas sp. ALB115 TaxID=3403074 RepID=UPI003BB4E9F9